MILHQGDFLDFLRYGSDEYSEVARRLTDLFELPDLFTLKDRFVDRRHVNVTERGEKTISKSEVIIANCLYKYDRQGLISYAYEDKFVTSGGIPVKPDFTIEHLSTGRRFYWEHLGMMGVASYREKWELKRKAYIASGLVPSKQAGPEADRVLIVTEDTPDGGINSRYIDEIVRKTILGEQT